MVVYPRWRGELFCALAFCWLSRGLSPLARGTLCRCQHCWRVIRFIPAGAGNTLPLSALLARNTVYPRWRGEHRSSHYFPFFFDGLSPLARGTRRQRIVRLPLHRFIPAGAGNTSPLLTPGKSAAVYPRWRGEHPFIFVSSWRDLGLSPLAGNTDQIPVPQSTPSVYPRWRGEHN